MSFIDYCIVIPAREGSSRCKNKMDRAFYGNMNLLEWKLHQLCSQFPTERIYVSTNSDTLKLSANSFGVNIHHREDLYCNGDKTTFSEVIINVVSNLPHEHIMWCPSTSPLMKCDEYVECLREYEYEVVNKQSYDSLITVEEFHEYFLDSNGPLNCKIDSLHHVPTQNLSPIYKITFGSTIRSKKGILENKYFIGEFPFLHKLGTISSMDIDTEEEFKMCQSLIGLIM
jgi:CMP-N-acetylneuraminic acid synthetase